METKQLLKQLIARADWDGLRNVLAGLSNAERRRCEQLMRDEILAELGNERFWQAFAELLRFKPQAFITAILAARRLAETGELDLAGAGAHEAAALLSEVQRKKLVRIAMPILRTREQIEAAFATFGIDRETDQIGALMQLRSPLAYYLVFQTLAREAHPHETAAALCGVLAARADDVSLNMAAILKCAYRLDDVRLPYALSFNQYEISHLAQSLENFDYALHGKRPKV